MPRDSHLLSAMSQALLRAARSGEIVKKAPPQPLLEDDKENGEDEEADADIDQAFMARRWAVVPRHLEGPEPEFLAKRRKGLPSAYTGTISHSEGTAPMRKTKVRKFDADGNASILEVLIPEGQTVDGEVLEDEANVTEAPAPGTVVQGVGVVNAEGVVIAGDQAVPTPPKRRPPPPKRKAKGPGRGRKKKVAFAPGAAGSAAANMAADSSGARLGANGLPSEHYRSGTMDEDGPMGDNSILQQGEESSEDDDEGDEGDEGEREEGELSPSLSPSKSPSKELPSQEPLLTLPLKEDSSLAIPAEAEETAKPANEASDISGQREPSSSPDLPFATSQPMQTPMAAFDAIQDVDPTSTPQVEHVDVVKQEAVEEHPRPDQLVDTEVVVQAEISQGHDPQDDHSVARSPNFMSPRNLEGVKTEEVPPGEIDLLGSLERQLDQSSSVAQAPHENPG